MKFSKAKSLIEATYQACLHGELGSTMQQSAQAIILLDTECNKRLKTSAGQATSWHANRNRRIQLAEWACDQWSQNEVDNTALHELAHCLAPRNSKHNATWHSIFRALLNFNNMQDIPTEQYYSCDRGIKQVASSVFEGMIHDVQTVEDCVTLSAQIKSATHGKAKDLLLATLSTKLFTLV